MDKYIKAYDVIEWFRPYWHTSESISFEELAESIRHIIEPADVAPVVHGAWKKWRGDYQHHCTVCECYANAQRNSMGCVENEFLDDYCPNCGARMDGES